MVTPSTSMEEMLSSDVVEQTHNSSYHSHYKENELPQSQGRSAATFFFWFE